MRRLLGRYGWDALGLVLAVLYALPSIEYPFAGDQSIHWYIGAGLLEGEVPYATGVSTKPLATFLVHAASLVFFGDHPSSIRIMDLVFVVLAGVLIGTFRTHSMARRDGDIGAAALLMSGLHYTYFDYSDTAHPELWQSVLMLASAWIVTRASPSLSWKAALASGAFACGAVLFKHTAAIFGVVVGLSCCGLGWLTSGFRRALSCGAAFTVGVALVLGASVIPFGLTGTVGVLWEVMVERVFVYAERASGPWFGTPPWFGWKYGGVALAGTAVTWALGMACAIWTGRRSQRRLGLWIAVLTGVAFSMVVVQRRALSAHVFSYHFVAVGPLLVLSTHWGLRQLSPKRGTVALAGGLLFVALGFFWEPRWVHHPRSPWSYRAQWEAWIEYKRGSLSRERFDDAFYGLNPLDRYDRQQRVGQVVRQLAHPGDTMCVEGFATAVYAVAGLRCTSRFFVKEALRSGLPRWRREYERTLRDNPPTFIVTFSDRRRRIHELERYGYRRYDVHDGNVPWFVVMQR